MARYLKTFLAFALCASILITSCSGNGPDPVLPDPASTGVKVMSDENSSARYLLDFTLLSVDTETGDIEIIPARSAGLHLNLTGIFNGTMGMGAVGVPSEADPPHGLFCFDISLTHPFATMPQFSGFDVRGILMSPGTLAVGSLTFSNPATGETRLLNADGYTRWWNPVEFTGSGILGYIDGALATASPAQLTASMNPYKYFADALSADASLAFVTDAAMDSDIGRGVFRAGSVNTRRYKIQFPMNPGPKLVFGYAIDCSWSAPTVKPPAAVPDDFPINANQPEAYRISIPPFMSVLYYDSESGTSGGVFHMRVNVYDWQGQNSGNIQGQIDSVRIFAPDLFSGGIDAVFDNANATRAQYFADLTGQVNPTHAGAALVAVKVKSAGGESYIQGVSPAPDATVSAWNAVPVEIIDPECVGDANNDWLEAVPLNFGQPVVDQVCLPDDYRDFYTLELDPGYEVLGEIRLYCDASPTTLGIYDQSHNLIMEASVSSGLASISFESANLVPGSYFVRVLTSNNTQTCPYVLELAAEMIDVTPDTPVDVTPPWLYCNPLFVFYNDNLVYLSGNAGAWVYDVSDPNNPAFVSATEEIYPGDTVCFNYPYMYYARRETLSLSWVSVIDFSDPTNPVHHPNILSIPSDHADIEISDNFLYLATSVQPNSEVIAYDYTIDPFNPTQVTTVIVPYEPQILEVFQTSGGDEALAAGTWDDIYTFYWDTPTTMASIGSYNIPSGSPRDIAAYLQYLYIGWDKDGYGDGAVITLMQGASSLLYIGQEDTPGSARNIAVEFPQLYVGDGTFGLSVLDITTPNSPNYLVSLNLLSYALDLAVNNDIVYIIPQDAGLQIIDTSIPSTPDPLSHLHVLNYGYSEVKKDNYLIVGEFGNDPYGSLKTIDVSIPEEARVVGEYYPPERPWHLTLNGDLLCATFQNQWTLLDASDPVNLSYLYTKNESYDLTFSELHGTTLYVVHNTPSQAIQIYDVTNPSLPSYSWTMNGTNNIRDIDFSGNYMFVTEDLSVEVYSLTNPLIPNSVGSYSYSIWGYDSADIQGSYLYLCSQDTLEIASISTPATPAYTGSVLLPVVGFDFYYNIDVDGQVAYMSGYFARAYSALIWPAASPSLIGYMYEGYAHGSRELIADNNYLYEAADSRGLKIFRLY